MADQRSARSKLNKKEQRSLRASKSRMSQRKRKPQKVSKRATNRSKELTRKPSAEQVGSVVARKPSAEQMEPSRSVFAKKPSCEPLDSPVRPFPGAKPPVALPKPGTVPSPRGPSPVIAPAPVAQVQVKKSETFDKTAVKKMEDRIKKKKEDKEKKDKEKELNKQKQKKKDTLKAGDEAFPKYTMLKTTEEVSKYSQIQAVDGMASVKVTGKAYLGRLKNKGFKNNDNNGQLFLKDPVSGKDKPFWHSDQLYKPPLTDDELVLNAETILAVVQGQVQLSKSDEDWTAKCDQFAKLSTLQEKDETAFSNAIIKGNSVRSMMNVDRPSAPEITATTTEERLAQEMDFHMKKLQESESYTLGEVHFHEPTMARVYDTINRANIHLEPFTPRPRYK